MQIDTIFSFTDLEKQQDGELTLVSNYPDDMNIDSITSDAQAQGIKFRDASKDKYASEMVTLIAMRCVRHESGQEIVNLSWE